MVHNMLTYRQIAHFKPPIWSFGHLSKSISGCHKLTKYSINLLIYNYLGEK